DVTWSSRAILRVLRTGSSVWGVSSRMAVKATRPPNATGLPGASARIAGRSGRHQLVAESLSVNDWLHDVAFAGGHPNRSVEELHVFETGVAEPAVDLGVQVLPLECRRVPIERIQPAPAPVRFHGNGQRQAERFSDDRQAIRVIEV